MQAGDILNTYADIHDLVKDFSFKPKVTISKGIANFTKWYLDYYSP